MRVCVFSYGSLVRLPCSPVTGHDLCIRAPFKKAEGLTLPALLGMPAYIDSHQNKKITACIATDSPVEVQVWHTQMQADNVPDALVYFALREGCSIESIGLFVSCRDKWMAARDLRIKGDLQQRMMVWLAQSD
jgi:hypothetical protein